MSNQHPQFQQQPYQPVHPPTQPPMPHRKPRKWLPWAAGAGAFLLGLVIGAAPSSDSTSPSASAQPTVTVSVPGEPGAKVTVTAPPVTKPAPPAKTVTAPPPQAASVMTEDGIYLVGVDIKPGTYRSGSSGDCYWARLSNTNGDLDSIIANHNGGNSVVTIRRTDKAFETARCGEWRKVG
jgi:hypothetical protein